MGRPVHIDSFSTLDAIPAKHRRDPLRVLSVLREEGRFSVFDVDAKTGAALNEIKRNGWAEFETLGYPWTKAHLTKAGRAALGGRGDG